VADVGIKELLHGHLALGISCDFLVKQYVNVCHSYNIVTIVIPVMPIMLIYC
jgi:hypothetical protein